MPEFTPAELARLADYFAHELDPEDVAVVERWIDESEDRKRFVHDLFLSRFDLGPDATARTLDLPSRVEALSWSLAQIRATERPERVQPIVPRTDHSRLQPRLRFNVGVFSRAVGYATGVIIASVLLFVVGQHLTPTRGALRPSSVMSTYTTGKGERATITLPDGTTILLNVASRIDVPIDYAAGNRTVQLSGEALFRVIHRSGAPFTVVSGPSTTRVLGTSFVVRHYETDTAAFIAVRDGKVTIGPVVLTGEQATVVSAAGNPRVLPADGRQFGFVNGVIELDHIPFPDAIPELNRWYNADIRLGDSALVTRQVFGVFEAGSLTDLISILELTFDVRVVREGRVLTLYQRS